MEIKIKRIDNVKFEAETRGHRVVCDQPPSLGGEDAGMTPPEFLLVSLGTCAEFYAVQYLKTRGLPVADVEVTVTAEKLEHPARLAGFRIEVTVPGLPPEHEAGVLRSVKACLVHHTLLSNPTIETTLQTLAVA